MYLRGTVSAYLQIVPITYARNVGFIESQKDLRNAPYETSTPLGLKSKVCSEKSSFGLGFRV